MQYVSIASLITRQYCQKSGRLLSESLICHQRCRLIYQNNEAMFHVHLLHIYRRNFDILTFMYFMLALVKNVFLATTTEGASYHLKHLQHLIQYQTKIHQDHPKLLHPSSSLYIANHQLRQFHREQMVYLRHERVIQLIIEVHDEYDILLACLFHFIR